MPLSRALFVDDRDPSIIYSLDEYQRAWKPFTGEGTEFMLTTSHADRVGASAKLTFKGSDISVFGSISPANHFGGADPLSHYILDSNPPFPFRPLPNNDTQYNVMFYQSPKNLSDGLHTLQITLRSSGSYWLDYMVINGNPSLSVVANDGPPTSTTESTRSQTIISQQSSTLLSTVTASTTSVPSPGQSGAIVASSILGGLLGIVVLVLGFIWFIRRRRTSERSNDAENTPTPYTSSTFDLFTTNRGAQRRLSETIIIRQPSSTRSRSKHRVSALNLEPPPLYYSPGLPQETA